MLQNVFSFSRTLRVLCDFCVSNAYTWTIYFYSWVLYVQLRFQLSSHSFHPQYLWQFSKQLADSYLVFFMLPVITPGYPLTWSAGGSGMSNSVTPWTGARQTPLSVGFCRPEYWSGYPFPSPGDLNQRSNPGLPHCRQIIYHLSHEYALVILFTVWATRGPGTLVILIYCWSDHNTRSTLAFIYKRYIWNFCVYLHSHKITKNWVALEMQKTISVLLHDFMCNRNLLFISCLNDF